MGELGQPPAAQALGPAPEDVAYRAHQAVQPPVAVEHRDRVARVLHERAQQRRAAAAAGPEHDEEGHDARRHDGDGEKLDERGRGDRHPAGHRAHRGSPGDFAARTGREGDAYALGVSRRLDPGLKSLVALVSAIVLCDTIFYSAITPLLPTYADEHGISKTGAGILEATYAAGTLVGAIPAGILAARVGVRATVLLGLALLGISSFVFGVADSILLLDLARFVQGVGGACSWAGALAWLVALSPAERRGELIGTAMGAAIVGALLGPALGALAEGIGTASVFSLAAVLAAGLAVAALRIPAPERSGAADPRSLGRA